MWTIKTFRTAQALRNWCAKHKYDYQNIETGRQFTAVYGAFSHLRSENDVVYAGYDNLVFEKT